MERPKECMSKQKKIERQQADLDNTSEQKDSTNPKYHLARGDDLEVAGLKAEVADLKFRAATKKG
jgi:hypothetical protein